MIDAAYYSASVTRGKRGGLRAVALITAAGCCAFAKARGGTADLVAAAAPDAVRVVIISEMNAPSTDEGAESTCLPIEITTPKETAGRVFRACLLIGAAASQIDTPLVGPGDGIGAAVIIGGAAVSGGILLVSAAKDFLDRHGDIAGLLMEGAIEAFSPAYRDLSMGGTAAFPHSSAFTETIEELFVPVEIPAEMLRRVVTFVEHSCRQDPYDPDSWLNADYFHAFLISRIGSMHLMLTRTDAAYRALSFSEKVRGLRTLWNDNVRRLLSSFGIRNPCWKDLWPKNHVIQRQMNFYDGPSTRWSIFLKKVREVLAHHRGNPARHP